jgi:hypothetical protein
MRGSASLDITNTDISTGFLDLPRELRDMIYTEVAKATKVTWDATQPKRCVAHLLVANKQIFTQFLPVMQALS